MKRTLGHIGLSLLAVLFIAGNTWAQNKAGVLIKNSTGETISRCVEFIEAEITVEELLNRSGFTAVTQQSSFGAYVCYLHDDGVTDCSNHPDGWFWNFFNHNGELWESASAGISSVTATDGSLFGFAFGAWGEVTLPETTYADVCEITNLAGLVIDHSDGNRVVTLVDYPGETITGLQLLQRSGLDLTTNTTSFGTAICAIDGEGQPSGDCWGDPEGRYWGFNILGEGDVWVSSMIGVSDAVIYPGDVHGFFYAAWGVEQPNITHEDVFTPTTDINNWALYR